jgi:hypothetical protein
MTLPHLLSRALLVFLLCLLAGAFIWPFVVAGVRP